VSNLVLDEKKRVLLAVKCMVDIHAYFYELKVAVSLLSTNWVKFFVAPLFETLKCESTKLINDRIHYYFELPQIAHILLFFS
jgi:hypothetical protein